MAEMCKIEGEDKISHPSILGLWPGSLLLHKVIKFHKPRPVGGEPMAGFPKGRSPPLVEGKDKAPPENASVQGGRKSPYREFTYEAFLHFFEPSLIMSPSLRPDGWSRQQDP